MKTRFILGLAIFSLTPIIAEADTIARLLPVANQAMITVFRGRISGDDSNGKFLFGAMNVPVQSTLMGPSKSITDSAKVMSWVCGDREADGHQCTFMIQKSSHTKIDFNPIRVNYEITGQEAQNLFAQITVNTTVGEFRFTNTEGTLSMLATAKKFILEYRE